MPDGESNAEFMRASPGRRPPALPPSGSPRGLAGEAAAGEERAGGSGVVVGGSAGSDGGVGRGDTGEATTSSLLPKDGFRGGSGATGGAPAPADDIGRRGGGAGARAATGGGVLSAIIEHREAPRCLRSTQPPTSEREAAGEADYRRTNQHNDEQTRRAR